VSAQERLQATARDGGSVNVAGAIIDHLDLWTGAITKKSTSGRGSSGKIELTGIKKLRELILSLAVRGKLVPQNSEGPSAASLLVDIEAKKKELYHAKIVKKPKKLCQPQSDEAPWPLPSSWEWVKLPDVYYPISPSGKKLKSSETLDIGQFPVVDQGQSYISGYTDDASLVIEIPHPVIVFGDHTTARKYIDFSFVPGADGTKILCPILVNPRFFYLQLLGYDLENRGYARHFKVLNENFFALPPLAEQHRIVQKVDELMALCDRLEQQTSDQLDAHETLVDTLLGTLTQSENATELADNWSRLAAHFDTLFTTEQSIDKLKQTILQLAVMGRLVEQNAGDELVHNLRKRIATTKAKLIDSGALRKQKPIPALDQDKVPFTAPGNWEWVTFGEITFNRDAERIPLSVSDRRTRSGEFDYYGASGIIDKIDDYLFDSPLLLIGEDGANLINRSTPIAFIARGKYWVNNHAHVIDGISEDFLRYLCLYINATSLEPYVTGTAQPKMNQAKMNSIPVPLPPEKEQHRIVQKVDELMALCDQLKERLSQASETRCQLAEAVVEGALN
jgi:type I restriction enzyme S subunit